MTITEEVIRMDETNLINAMHDVLLYYCVTTLRTKKAALAGHDCNDYCIEQKYLSVTGKRRKSK